ncbi:hypothetical protein [Acetobacter tropicalis]|uniref:hypothetical protein n=1 Tax=Acetobacter tropicalis TaxID=104102 RepID=UPI0011D231BB|nr:hypothetical protein [Acetobacter tropicalis]
MNIDTIIKILSAVVTDVPVLIEVVEKIIEIYQSKNSPTDSDWEQINALVDQTHKELHSDDNTTSN